MSDFTGNMAPPCKWCGDNHWLQWQCSRDGLRQKVERLREALKPFAAVAVGIPGNWPDDCRLRIDWNERMEWLAYHSWDDKRPLCLPTLKQWREAAKAAGGDDE